MKLLQELLSMNDMRIGQKEKELAASKKDKIIQQATKDVQKSLDRAKRDDEIDCVSYAIELEDGRFVKVWVEEGKAEDFEEKLSQALGRDQDVEQVLRDIDTELANAIVDVEWPDVDDEEDDELDGSESMSDEVDYDDDDPEFKAKDVKSYDKKEEDGKKPTK